MGKMKVAIEALRNGDKYTVRVRVGDSEAIVTYEWFTRQIMALDAQVLLLCFKPWPPRPRINHRE